LTANKLTFSIVTPSFNQAVFLPDALESVHSQGYGGQVEHIVIDGGSTDGSLHLLQSARHLSWVSEPDRGQSHALNKGFEMTTGELIGWLNADDFYLEDSFARVASYAAAHPDVDVIYGDCVFVDGSGGLLRSKNEHHFDRDILLYYGCFIPTTSTFFRRRVLERDLLHLKEDLHYLMDYELFLRMSSGGACFGWLPEELAAFRWHEGNKSYHATERMKERRAVQKEQRVDVCRTGMLAFREAAFRYRHIAAKLTGGGLMRQRIWQNRRGEDMRWWQ
jgi:glycosyltransferase involved in cell wall biosynthesis